MKKKAISFALAIALMLSIIVPAYAAVLSYTMTYYPGTADTVTNLPEADGGTGGEAYTVSSTIPQRAGYEFIDWTLDYGVAYIVTYVVNPDPTYGTPKGSTVPTDPTQYPPADPVIVKDQLTTTADYAFNAKGEKISGTWKFTPWDKDDFQIYEDTTITGGWTFTPTYVTKYHYTVHYVLWDDYLKGKITKVADDEDRVIDQLGIPVTEPAKTGNDLKPKYRKNYQPVPGYESWKGTIQYDGYEIWIFYQKKSSSSVVNPNSKMVTYEITPDPVYGIPADVTVPAKKTYSKGNTVEVAEAPVTAQDYAVLNGEKVPGTWTFTGWDKTEAFVISADTTISGSWIFKPAEEPEPEERASCTVRYLNQDGTPLAPEITYTGRRAGMQIRAEAKPIEGYNLLSDPFITITLQPGDNNIITFRYEKIVVKKASFTMRYLLKDGTPIADEKTVTGQKAGDLMTAKAKTITGYRLISDELITITLQEGDNNIFTFYYEKEEPVKEEISEDVPEDATKDAPKDAPKDVPEGADEDADKAAPIDTTKDVPKDAAKDAIKEEPKEEPKDPPTDPPAPLNTEPQPDRKEPTE